MNAVHSQVTMESTHIHFISEDGLYEVDAHVRESKDGYECYFRLSKESGPSQPWFFSKVEASNPINSKETRIQVKRVLSNKHGWTTWKRLSAV